LTKKVDARYTFRPMNKPRGIVQATGSAERRTIRSRLKFPLAILGHFGYLFSLTTIIIMSVALLPLLPFPRIRRAVAGRFLRGFLGLFALYYLPAVQACKIVECSGLDHLKGGGPAIIVANHRSSIDAILLLALLPPTGLIIKARHVRKPAYACLVRFFDFVSTEAGTPSAIRRSLDKCRELLASGMNLLIFPEGMRASSSRLMPFADLAFRVAIEQGVPIVPVVIHSDRPFLNRQPGSYFPPETVQFRIRVLSPIPTQTERNPHRLSDTVSRQMASVLADWDRQYLKCNPGRSQP